MSTLDHPAAHEYLADLALEPGRLAELARSTDLADAALRDHIAGCATCRTDFAELGEVQALLAQTLDGTIDVDQPGSPPPSLRESVLASLQQAAPAAGRRASLGDRRARQPLARLIVAAAAGLVGLALLGGAWLIADQQARLQAAAVHNEHLVELADVLGRVLTTPDHQAVVLQSADGRPAGTLAWTRREIVVLSRTLHDPGAEQVYRCWVVRDGAATGVGRLYFDGGWAHWSGTTDGYAQIDLRPGGQFVVSLEPAGAPTDRPLGPIMLHADLGT